MIREKKKMIHMLAYLASFVGFCFVPSDFFVDVAQELIAFFGLIMAGVLPTMVLTASAIRSSNLSVKQLIHYGEALRKQLSIWYGLFVIALFATGLVIVGKLSSWSILIPVWDGGNINLIHILNGLIGAALVVFILRVPAIGRGINSLLKFSTDLAVGEAKMRIEEQSVIKKHESRIVPERLGFGEYTKNLQ